MAYGTLVRVGIAVALGLWSALAFAMCYAVIREAGAGWEVANSRDLIAPLVAGTGVLIAVLAFIHDREKIANDRAEAKSKVLYEQAKQGLEQAYEQLEGLSQDRIVWIRAARLLVIAKSLASSITSNEYAEAYRLAAESVRARLYTKFNPKNSDGDLLPLPPAFFFGYAEWRTSQYTLNQLAVLTATPIKVRSVSPENPVPDPCLLGLEQRSVCMVMDFLNFPSDYADPFDQIDKNIWRGWREMIGHAQGARTYIEHRERYFLINKRLYDRESKEYVDVLDLDKDGNSVQQ